MYYVFDQELDTLGSASAQASLHLAFFGVSIGAAITLAITLGTVEIGSPRAYAAFWGAFLLSVVSTLYFGIRAALDFRRSRRQIREIRKQSREREPEPKP